MIIATATIGFIFLYLTIATFSMLNKARMYPPKKVLKQRISVFGSLAIFFIAVTLLLMRIQ
ncbi:hypothetical protein JEG43_02360 [Anoxybacillus sp. LAT_35]|uniref:Uncharacterized protein n=1 Tax=Anoxybacillus flavithermus NBRC 109594 TaxID=1315967 RepID=R4FBR9_9BACL|nr:MULTISPECIES: hypothetical protein [Anoxybacillus]MCG5025228.1 hypothetical protein [Anoxybacillus flavithermus]MCG6199078.1 hypothetical protein [Anoxybacillus sp. LAT_38]MCG3085044.1 hypothetical protein [Anoxybacillus sp. LAT27]MCG6171794.1 hypothetical protein [Anoxybacillus sp. LAT_11]MCG6174953.1 hypothetical protein [Anoxybacillus sp. LAT_31]